MRRVACSVGKGFLFYIKLLTLLHTFIENNLHNNEYTTFSTLFILDHFQ